jgi:flagellar hook assembly protein FlgD
MTVTGKVVREIDMDELGPLHIGRNITEYAWDGHDDFGDQLANGVYLYRVITRLNGESIELNQTQASQYFTKSFGKMYLMR